MLTIDQFIKNGMKAATVIPVDVVDRYEKHLPGVHNQQKHAGEIKHVSDLLHTVAVGRYVTVSEIYRYAKSIGFVKDKQDFSKIMTQYLRTHKQTSRGHSIYTELPFTQKDSDFEIRRNEVSGRIGRIMIAGMPEKPVEPPPIVPEEKHLPGIHNQQSHAGTHVVSKVTIADIEHDQAVAKRLHDDDLDYGTEQQKAVRYAHLLVDEDYEPEAGGENTEQRLLREIFGDEYEINKIANAFAENTVKTSDEPAPKVLTRDEELAQLENDPAIKHMYAWQASFEDTVNNAPRYYRGVDYDHVKKLLRADEIEPLGDEFAGGTDVSMTIDPNVTATFGNYTLIIDGPTARQHGAKAFDYTDEQILYNDERGWEAEEQEVVSERAIPKEAILGIITPGGDILSLNKGAVQKHLPGIHNQQNHAGEHGANKIVTTFVPEWDLETEPCYPSQVTVYKLKNWSDLPNFDKGTYIFTVDRFSNDIYAVPTSRVVHEEMLSKAAPEKNIDDVVRFRIRSGRIEVSTYNAGIVINSKEDEFLAFDEIYKALDKIVAIGIPKTYPVSIRTEYGRERYFVTTLKSLVEKHLPGQHSQLKHAGRQTEKILPFGPDNPQTEKDHEHRMMYDYMFDIVEEHMQNVSHQATAINANSLTVKGVPVDLISVAKQALLDAAQEISSAKTTWSVSAESEGNWSANVLFLDADWTSYEKDIRTKAALHRTRILRERQDGLDQARSKKETKEEKRRRYRSAAIAAGIDPDTGKTGVWSDRYTKEEN